MIKAIVLSLCLVGCASLSQNRQRDINDDVKISIYTPYTFQEKYQNYCNIDTMGAVSHGDKRAVTYLIHRELYHRIKHQIDSLSLIALANNLSGEFDSITLQCVEVRKYIDCECCKPDNINSKKCCEIKAVISSIPVDFLNIPVFRDSIYILVNH